MLLEKVVATSIAAAKPQYWDCSRALKIGDRIRKPDKESVIIARYALTVNVPPPPSFGWGYIYETRGDGEYFQAPLNQVRPVPGSRREIEQGQKVFTSLAKSNRDKGA